MELAQTVTDTQRFESARLHGIEAARAGSVGSGLRGLVKAFYTTIPQIQSSNPCYKKYSYGERVAFTAGLMEGLRL